MNLQSQKKKSKKKRKNRGTAETFEHITELMFCLPIVIGCKWLTSSPIVFHAGDMAMILTGRSKQSTGYAELLGSRSVAPRCLLSCIEHFKCTVFTKIRPNFHPETDTKVIYSLLD